ncbi:MAG: rhomboid family intramembrane serine protease [Pseudomonadota bacterium]
MTPWLRNLLIVLVALYVCQILLERWVGLPITALGGLWAPMTPMGFSGMTWPWQPLTALLLNGEPLQACFDWLMLWFFLPPTLQVLGRRGTLKILALAWLAGIAVGALLVWSGIVLSTGPYLGLTGLTTAMVVVYGLANPNATIRLYFVLPIKGIWIVYLEFALLILFFLAYRDFTTTLDLAGSTAALLWMVSDGSIAVLWLKAKRQWLRRRRSFRTKKGRFDVIDGGRSGGPGAGGWVN